MLYIAYKFGIIYIPLIHSKNRRGGFYIRPLKTYKITAIFCRGRVSRPAPQGVS